MLAAFVLGACSDAPNADVVAQVGAWTLSNTDLAELLVVAQPFPLESDAVEELARHWVGAAALAQRAQRGDELTGADAVAFSTWLEQREALLSLDREDRLGSMPVPNTEATYREGDVRLVAHVLRRVGPETSAAEADLQSRAARRILSALVGGGSWETAVSESQDPDTRDASGLLGLFGPGELPAELDRVAFRLEPGQISSVVQSPAGLHIMYRPSFEEVAGLFATRLRDRVIAEADAESAAGLLSERGVTYAPEATAALRRIARDPWAALSSGQEVARWDGGVLAENDVARIVVALPPSSRMEMSQAEEPALLTFLEEVALRELRVLDAEARGLALSEELVGLLADQHAEEVTEWMRSLGVEEDLGLARAALDRYMDGIVSRQVEGRSLPPLFEAWLLDGITWTLDPQGVSGAIAEARAMLEGATGDTPP